MVRIYPNQSAQSGLGGRERRLRYAHRLVEHMDFLSSLPVECRVKLGRRCAHAVSRLLGLHCCGYILPPYAGGFPFLAAGAVRFVLPCDIVIRCAGQCPEHVSAGAGNARRPLNVYGETFSSGQPAVWVSVGQEPLGQRLQYVWMDLHIHTGHHVQGGSGYRRSRAGSYRK